MKYLIIILLGIFAAGCASRAHQTERVLQTPPLGLPLQAEIPDVPFVNQSAGHCGPATLAMAMNWAGHGVTVDQLVPQVYTPGMKGSLQLDMISASRRNGMMAVQIQGLSSLLTEISAGHPVIVFENLALTWAPQYHYAVVYGYDLQKEVAIMHSGPEKAKPWDLRKFERSWMLGDYWGLVVLNPGELSAAGTELAHVTAAAGLEQAGKITEAEKSYRSILERWPTSLGALVGMGNISYSKKNFKASIEYLRSAAKFHPESKAVLNNLAVAEKAAAGL